MSRILRALAFLLLGVVAIAGAFLVAARFGDGPIGPVAGGPLVEGELAEPLADWTPVAEVSTVEFQLLEPPRSRTVWTVVHEGRLFVPCGAPNFRLWKQWPHEAMEDGRAVLRIDGRRYELEAERVTDPALVGTVLDLVTAKYDLPGTREEPGEGGAPPDDSVWIFEMVPRA